MSTIRLTKRIEQVLLNMEGIKIKINKDQETTFLGRQRMKNLKYFFSAFVLVMIGSCKANTFKENDDLPTFIKSSIDNLLETILKIMPMEETRASLITGDGILLLLFTLWVAYIVFFFPKNTLKKM